MLNFLQGKRTYIISILLGLVAVIKMLSGDMTFTEFLNSESLSQLLAAFGLASLRAGVSKSGTTK